ALPICTAACSAYAPGTIAYATRSPLRTRVTPSPTPSPVPAASEPGVKGSGSLYKPPVIDVDEVDADGLDAHQRLPRRRRRLVEVEVFENFGAAGLPDANRFHGSGQYPKPRARSRRSIGETACGRMPSFTSCGANS